MAVLAAWLSFGPDAGLYSLMYRYVPAFTLLRAPARFGIVVTLALAVLAALGTAHLLRGRRRAPAIAAALCLAAAAELISVPLPFREVPPTPAPYALLAHLPPGAVAEFPFFYREVDFHRHASYMLQLDGALEAARQRVQRLPAGRLPGDGHPGQFVPGRWKHSTSSRSTARGTSCSTRTGTITAACEKVEDRIRQYSPYLRKLASEGDIWLYEIVGWPDREPS